MTFFVFPCLSSSFCLNRACARPVTQHGIVTRCTLTQHSSITHVAHAWCTEPLASSQLLRDSCHVLRFLFYFEISVVCCQRLQVLLPVYFPFLISVTCVSFSAPLKTDCSHLCSPAQVYKYSLPHFVLLVCWCLLSVVSVQVCCTVPFHSFLVILFFSL